MAEIKNSFTSAKMNQDLDDRLIPSNEYREGRNISIISSDSSNTGAIENILGNEFIRDMYPGLEDATVIGYIVDQTSSTLYAMITNYTDTSANQLDAPLSYVDVTLEKMAAIVKLNLLTNAFSYLVSGTFLNFSKTHPITGINLVENLLFWTDNRNQPRKINVVSASNNSTYYTTEDQISVAKYAPIDSIVFIDNQGNCTMKDVTSQYLPDGTTANPYYNATSPVDPAYTKGRFIRFSYRFRFDDGEYSIFAPFSQIAFIPQQDGSFLVGDEDATYRSSIVAFMKNKVNQIGLIIPLPTTGNELFDLYKINEIDILYKESDSLAVQVLDTIMPGSDSVDGFAYKPNELAGVTGITSGTTWTLFTSPTGNLNYNGYVHGSGSTVALVTSLAAVNLAKYQISWTIIGSTAGTVSITYGGVTISSKTISGSQNLTTTSTGVLSISPTTDFNGRVILSIIPKTGGTLNPYISNTNNFYNYTYQSRKPKSTLPNDQLIRVYDKVPVRALAQESSGGRIIYGNYIDKHTPPNTLDYNVRLSDKGAAVKTEYPLHTVKQNRNYQVGIILSDRYGRQSDVILSTVNDGAIAESENFGGSTFYTPYRKSTDTSVLDFVGSSIKILFNDYITSSYSPLNDLGITATGQPGLYETGGKLLKASISGQFTSPETAPGTYTNVPVYNNGIDSEARVTITVIADGEVVDPIIVTNSGNGGLPYQGDAQLQGAGLGAAIKVDQISKANPLGWYSYKVVVKQTQQEYYNVYLPGILNAYPGQDTTTFPTTEADKTSHTVLFSDNINKIPRDLSEVGPDQKQYRSSVRLFGRVQNNYTTTTSTANWTSGALFITLTTPNSSIKLGDIVTGVGIATGSVVTNIASTIITLSLATTAIGTAVIVTFSNENNIQFFPTSISGFSVSTLANASDLGMTDDLLNANGQRNLYQLTTNPIIGRISTNGQPFGVLTTDMAPYLAVVETDPIESNLDIYWETSTTGLISDLNALISQSAVGAYSFINVSYRQFENQNPGGGGTGIGTSNSPYVTDSFYPVDYAGQVLTTPVVSLVSVRNANGDLVTPKFSLVPGSTSYTWRIKINTGVGNEFLYSPLPNENQFIFTLAVTANGVTNQLIINGSLNNNTPIITTYTTNLVYAGWPIGTAITTAVSGVNGSYSPSTNTSGLIWSFDDSASTRSFGTTPNNFTLTMSSLGILTLTIGTPIIPITFNVKLTDSGGMFALQAITLDFSPGEFNLDFNLDFNL
jgi:hypothetical protein